MSFLNLSRFTRYYNRQLFLGSLIVAVSSLNYGFDQNAFSNVLAMDPFIKRFGRYDESAGTYALGTTWLSLFNSLNYLGYGVGVIVGSVISKRFGRRWCMFVMSAHAIVCMVIAVTSKGRDQIMVARVLNYIYIGMELAVVPVFQSEIVPGQVRGLAVGSYQMSLMVGGLTMNCICRGTSTLSTDASWRIPLGLFALIPALVLSVIFMMPESPRWLLTKDRVEEARVALGRLRTGAFTEEEIDDEFRSLQYALSIEPEQGRWVEMFQGVNRKRTALIIFMNFFQQATGQAFVSSYGAVFVKSIGTINPLNMTIVNASANVFMGGVGIFILDKVGRKPILLIGAVWMTAAILTMGGLGTILNQSLAVKKATVAMLPIFSSGYAGSWSPLTYVITTEITALRLRDVSQRTASIVNVVTAFVVSFAIPYMIYSPGNLGSKVGFIFGSMTVLSFFFALFFVPECKGKTLEEIDIAFHEGVPLRKIGSYKCEQLEVVSAKAGKDDGEDAIQTLPLGAEKV